MPKCKVVFARALRLVGWFKSFKDSRFAHYTVVVVFVKRMENKRIVIGGLTRCPAVMCGASCYFLEKDLLQAPINFAAKIVGNILIVDIFNFPFFIDQDDRQVSKRFSIIICCAEGVGHLAASVD